MPWATSAQNRRINGSGEYDSHSYSPSYFYTHSRDRKGFSEAIKTPMPPDWKAEITILVNSGKFPYRSIQDFARDAMIHRMHYLKEQSKDDPEMNSLLERWTEQHRADSVILQLAAECNAAEEVVEVLTALLNRSNGDRSQIEAMVRDAADKRVGQPRHIIVSRFPALFD